MVKQIEYTDIPLSKMSYTGPEWLEICKLLGREGWVWAGEWKWEAKPDERLHFPFHVFWREKP